MSAAVRLVALRETPLDIGEVYAAVADQAAGGVAVFVGTVRDSDDGRPVDSLAYSAHPSAEQQLRAAADRVAAQPSVIAVAVAHRVGDLVLGDLAVVVAASTAHRADAFAACRELIDDVKANVPIWKHQTFAGGTEEWVGTP